MRSGSDMPGNSTTCSRGNSGSSRWVSSAIQKLQGGARQRVYANFQRALVKVECWAVVRAAQAAFGVTRADKKVAAGYLVQEHRHVVRAHRSLAVGHAFGPNHTTCDTPRQFGHTSVVDARRARVGHADMSVDAKRLRNAGGSFLEARQQVSAELGGKHAQRAMQLNAGGDDVWRGAAVNAAERQHGWFEWGRLARDERLQRGDELGAGNNWIGHLVRHGGVAAGTAQLDDKRVGGGEDRPGPHVDLADQIGREQA